MNFFLLTLYLIFNITQITKAQTACADFVAGSYTLIQENSVWGQTGVHHFNCFDDILLDPSCSVGAPNYHIRVAEFDLLTGEWVKDFHSDWILGPVPPTINITKFFPANEPTCGKIYALGFVEGPGWNTADPVLFFTIDCFNISLNETYACKENILYSDFSEIKDKAHDQLLLDDGTRVITGTTLAGSQMRLFIEEVDISGNAIRKQAYPIKGEVGPNVQEVVSNVQIILDQQTNEYILFFDTNVSNNRDVYFLRVNRFTLAPINYYGPLVNDTPGGFSNEFAVKIEDNYKDKYMLVVNQHIPAEKNSYVVEVTKPSYFYCPSFIDINNSKQVVSHDIIETGSRISDLGCAAKTSYLLIGSVDNNAFIVGLDCNGKLFTDANIFDVDGNTSTIDPAKRIQYYSGNFYISGETGSDFSLGGSVVSGKIWLGSFTVNDNFFANQNWLNIYEKNTNRKESLVDMDYANKHLYLTGQTEIEDILISIPVSTTGPKAYIFSTDLNGNPGWAKEYAENLDTETFLCDIELKCGAIYGVGGCNDRVLLTNPNNPFGSINKQNIDIYRNKTNLIGELFDDDCYTEIFFEPIERQVPIELVPTKPIGECIEGCLPDVLVEKLICEVECCSNTLPCDTTCADLVVNQTFLQDTCCYNVGIENNYCDPIVCLETEVLTPGWQFNTSSINVNANYNGIPDPYKFKISYNSGFYPLSNTPNFMVFCLTEDSTVTNPSSNQQVKYTWYELAGADTLAVCDTTLNTYCEGYRDICLETDSVVIKCDSLDNVYKVTFQIFNYKTLPSTTLQVHGGGSGYKFSNSSTGPFNSTLTTPLIVAGSGGSAFVTIYVEAPGMIFYSTTECFGISLWRYSTDPNEPGYCCNIPGGLCINFDPCCIETEIISLVCDTINLPTSQYVLNFDVTNKALLPLQGLTVIVKNNDPSITLSPSGGYFDFTGGPVLQNNTVNLDELVTPFPITDTHLVLGYFAHYSTTLNIDSCCIETKCDSIPIPNCCDELIIDGDFDDPTGSTFTSSLTQNCNCTLGSWCIDVDADNKCSTWPNVLGPQSCSDNYLIVDGTIGTIWAQPIDLVEDECYEFSFQYHPNISGGGQPNLNVVIGLDILGSTTGVSGNWTSYTYNYTAPVTGTFNLIITQTTSTQFSDYGIDCISFGCVPCTPCPPIIINNDEFILDGLYHAAQKIVSAGTVPSTGNVDLKAGECIELKNGFTVEAGATFCADIAPCCCSDDPLHDLTWLQPFVSDPNYSISQGTYQNRCIFIVTDFCIVSDGVTAYYDCDGNLICTATFGGTTCPTGFNVQNTTVLQGC